MVNSENDASIRTRETKKMIGKIQRVPLRKVTEHEAYDFTKWLVDNIDTLNEIADLNLVDAKREQAAGSFSVDIVAEDEKSGRTVIIENQLEKSDHDHLGKVMTYLSNLDAQIAIWIVADPRPEHVKAISWLNESRLAKFYLVKVEAIKINESEPAFWFTLIVGPSEESRIIGEVKEETAERYDLRQEFWTQLLERAKPRTALHNGITPGQYAWIGTGAGKRGLGYNYSIRQEDVQAELYIDRGKDSERENKDIFDQLKTHQKEIEQVFGEPLSWERLENKRACRIKKLITVGGYRDPSDKWAAIHDAMIDAMIRLEKALRPFIAKLDI